MRFWVAFIADRLTEEQKAQIPMRRAQAEAALKVMDNHLAGRRFFVADRLTLADITLYAYTNVAEEGDLTLAPYANIRVWLDPVAATPGYVGIEA